MKEESWRKQRNYKQNAIQGKLTQPTTGKVDRDWLKIKQANIEAAEESRKLKNQKWLRMWNDKITLAKEKKKNIYRKCLQNKTVEHFTEHRKQGIV